MSNKFRIAVRKFGPFESAIEKIWRSFCTKTGCSLKLEAVPMDLHALYEATLGPKNGLINGDWDVTYISTDWIAEADDKHALEDLAPLMTQQDHEDISQGWTDSLLNMQKFGDRILGLPFHDGPECLIYRKDLFNDVHEQIAYKAKFDKELRPPSTWSELYDIARFFNRPDQNLFGTAFALFPDGHNTVFDFCLQLWTRGGELIDENGHIVINSAAAVKGLEFYRKITSDGGAVHPDCKDFDSVKSGLAFANGEIAMMVNWFGFASMCEVYPDSKVKDCVDITNVPAGSNGQGVSLNVYWLYAIAAGSRNKGLAWDFIQYAVNAPNDKLLTLEGGIGCRKSTWNDTEVNATVPYYHKLGDLHENARTLPRKTNWSEIAKVIDTVVTQLIDSDKPVVDLLAEAQIKINIIEENR